MAESFQSPRPPSERVRLLCQAAMSGDRQFVDDNLKEMRQMYTEEADWFENVALYDKNGPIRDLAAIALEGRDISYRTKNKLISMLRTDPDEAVRFRAAIALNDPKHNDHSTTVMNIINAALNGPNEAMREKAKEALKKHERSTE